MHYYYHHHSELNYTVLNKRKDVTDLHEHTMSFHK